MKNRNQKQRPAQPVEPKIEAAPTALERPRGTLSAAYKKPGKHNQARSTSKPFPIFSLRALAVSRDIPIEQPPTTKSLRSFISRHPRTIDVIVGVIFLLLTLGPAEGSYISSTFQPISPRLELPTQEFGPGSARIVFIFVFGVTLAFMRRRHPWILLPLAILCVATGLGAPTIAISADGATVSTNSTELFCLVIAVYQIAARKPAKHALAGLGIGLSALWLIYSQINFFANFGAKPPVNSQALVYVIIICASSFLGMTVMSRSRYISGLMANAKRIEFEKGQQEKIDTAEERRRIAREMHDIVSHSLTVMIALAEGSSVTVAKDPKRARELLDTLSETGRDALDEMRRMLGVLQSSSDETPFEPHPRTTAQGDLHNLVQRFREAGLPLQFLSEGEQTNDQDLGLVIYRIAQEGLTNVLRHASNPSSVLLNIKYSAERIDVSVWNSRSGENPATHGSGRGLIGLDERVALYKGSLTSTATIDGGWLLHAVLYPRNEGER